MNNVVIYWVFVSHLLHLCWHVYIRMSVCDQKQSGIHEPNPLTRFPSFQIFPDIFPSSLPNLFQCPRFVRSFFLTPCPALSTHCLLMWMIIWRLPLKKQKTHCDRFKYDLQVSQNLFIMVHYGDQELILEEPSLSPWHCICIWHSMGFRWHERGTTIFTSSYMNAMHQSNPISPSLVTRATY